MLSTNTVTHTRNGSCERWNMQLMPVHTLQPHPLNRFDEKSNACLAAATSICFEHNITGVEQRVQARAAAVHDSGVLHVHTRAAAVLALPRHWQRVSRVVRTGQFLRNI